MRSFADAETRHGIVDHHGPSFDLTRQALAARAIARPNARRQSVMGIVSQTHGLGIIAETRNRQHRTKSLFLHHPHAMIDVRQNSRRKKSWAEFAQPRASRKYPRAAPLRIFQLGFH